MKLIYQQMLAFLTIILTSLAIVGYVVISFTTNQAYSQTYERLEGYANSLEQIAITETRGPNLGLTDRFLDNLQIVMQSDDVTMRLFDAKNNQIYPQSNIRWRLPKTFYRDLKRGQIIRIRNDHKGSRTRFSNKDAYTSVLVPWFDKGKLIGIIWIGSRVQNIEAPVKIAEHNLGVALIFTLIVGLVLSLVLSLYSTRKIKRLSRATQKVASGNFNVQIPHQERDEIDDLAANFNTMVQALKTSSEEVKNQEKRRDQFMADAAHEMRTPLTTINGLLEGLQYDAIPEEAKPKSIALMQRETKRLIRLVNENLDYEKIRNNQVMLIKTQFNAYTVLSDLVTQMQQKAKKAKDDLVLKVPDPLIIYADHDRFTQIMVNLVQNALQFTNDGVITISAKRSSHATQFSVSDTGIGMTPEQTKYIFERFYKADLSRARSGTGESGLGLAIVLSLVRQHGGQIKVVSTPQKGSTFSVTFYEKGYEHYLKDR